MSKAERPLRPGPGLGDGALESAVDHGVDRRIERLDALDRGLDRLDRRELPPRDARRELDAVLAADLVRCVPGAQTPLQGVSASPGVGSPSTAQTRPGASSVVKSVRRSAPE